MAVQETSAAAYDIIKANGVLSEIRFSTYEVVFKHGPITRNELYKHFPDTPNPEGSQGRALSKLLEDGLVHSPGKRRCTVSTAKMFAKEYVTTRLVPDVKDADKSKDKSKQPKKLQRPSKADLLVCCYELRAIYDELTKKDPPRKFSAQFLALCKWVAQESGAPPPPTKMNVPNAATVPLPIAKVQSQPQGSL